MILQVGNPYNPALYYQPKITIHLLYSWISLMFSPTNPQEYRHDRYWAPTPSKEFLKRTPAAASAAKTTPRRSEVHGVLKCQRLGQRKPQSCCSTSTATAMHCTQRWQRKCPIFKRTSNRWWLLSVLMGQIVVMLVCMSIGRFSHNTSEICRLESMSTQFVPGVCSSTYYLSEGKVGNASLRNGCFQK